MTMKFVDIINPLKLSQVSDTLSGLLKLKEKYTLPPNKKPSQMCLMLNIEKVDLQTYHFPNRTQGSIKITSPYKFTQM